MVTLYNILQFVSIN